MTYHNVKGAYFDNTLGKLEHGAISPEQYASVSKALKEINPNLKLTLWALVFNSELYEKDWAGFKPHMDVINLRVWSAKDLGNLDRDVDRCQEIFPDKKIVLGCNLWDYPTQSPMPLSMLKLQCEQVLKFVVTGKIDGYSIFATFLIDGVQERARWARDFIATH